MKSCLVSIASLNGDPTTYVAVPRTCKLADAVSAITTAVTTNDVTVTLSDGTTDIGTLTVAVGVAGGVDGITFDTTSYGDVELDRTTPLKIVCSGTPGAGAINLSLDFDIYGATKT